MDMLSGPKEALEEEEESPVADLADESGLADVQTVFDRLPETFQAGAAAGVDVVFQFRISGPGGGDWHAVIKDGVCTVEQGVHDRPTTALKMSDKDFLQYVGGQLPAMQAYTTGRLKIEGDLMKSQLVERLFKF
jgi:putative sterol carrier protein